MVCSYTWTGVPGIHAHRCDQQVTEKEHLHTCGCGERLWTYKR